MEFSSLKSLSKVYPLLVKKYEAFVPDMTEQDIVTKINSLIVYLNNIGKLSNDTATQWNNVMKWILNDGLTESVDKKIIELVSTGQFTDLLQLALGALNVETNKRLDGFETDVKERSVNVKTHYGAIGNNQKKTIAEVFPSVTLTQVQELNAEATLFHSSDWYAIQKALNDSTDVFIPSGNYIIDLPLVITKKSTITGQRRKTYIYNQGIGKNAFEVKENLTIQNIIQEGNSTTLHGMLISKSYVDVYDCGFNGNGGYGIKYDEAVHVVHSNIVNTSIYGNKLGGIYCVTNVNFQKTAIHIDKCYVVGNGSMADGVAQTTDGHGIHLGASLGHNVTNTVCEYNHGAGIYIANEGAYGVFNATVIGCYFEGNRYANIYVNAQDITLAYQEIFIKGNYYSTYPAVSPYYTNSRLTESIKTLIDNPSVIKSSIIDNKYFGFERMENQAKTIYPDFGSVNAQNSKTLDVDVTGIKTEGVILGTFQADLPIGIVSEFFPSTEGKVKIKLTNITPSVLSVGVRMVKVIQLF